MPPIIVSRFLINLRHAGTTSNSVDPSQEFSTTGGALSTLALRTSILGSMGGSLDHGFDEESLEALEELELDDTAFYTPSAPQVA